MVVRTVLPRLGWRQHFIPVSRNLDMFRRRAQNYVQRESTVNEE